MILWGTLVHLAARSGPLLPTVLSVVDTGTSWLGDGFQQRPYLSRILVLGSAHLIS